MPEAAVEDLLSGLNEPQRAAVTHPEGPLLVLAGAGSGKTRVLTHRIAWLVHTDRARPGEILAITFTNKAAQEMRERVELLLGRSTRSMWVMTFHAACARIMRAEAPRLGYTRQYTIYDQADSRRLVKQCLETVGADTKRFTPAAVQSQISAAKNRLRSAEDYGQMVGDYFEKTVAEVYELYDRELMRMNAMDFDDLLVRTVNVLELFPEVRARYSAAFRHVLVDEYQDTNAVQYRLLQLIAGEHRNLMVVGDDAQCLAEGTLVLMADGSERPIEQIRPGDRLEGGQVTHVFRNDERSLGVRLTLEGGRELVSTPEHKHVLPVAVRTSSPYGTRTPDTSVVAAGDVQPGHALAAPDGSPLRVLDIDHVHLGAVYDLCVEPTHSFVANGVLTHNSIYSFRSADITNILDFEETFPDATTVKLEQNYRSTQTILDAANAVIAHNRGQKPKTLWTELGAGDPIKVRELEDDMAEARFVVGELDRLVDEGVSLDEVAIFYRTHAQARVLEDTLVRREIPYQVIGGPKFYERAEIKDAVAYLTVLQNPQDVIAFQRIVNSPRRGIGQTSLSRVLAHAETMGVAVWEAAAAPEEVPGLGTAAVKALSRFMATMEGLRARTEETVPIGDLLEAVLHETGYIEALENERTFEAQGRLENLEQLVERAREFDARAEPQAETLDVFLQQVSLTADADSRRDDEGKATLMTLHNAKGLEYPIVFLIGLEEGVFPHSRALDEGGLEEERRLCYVGITRAMRNLYITHARRRNVFGSFAPGLPSRFLAELPTDAIDEDSRPATSSSGMLGRATSWASAGAAAATITGRGAEAASQADAPQFRLGDDVGHPAFGEGVVTAVEPGGIVVVRFAKDGSERKLMAEYAPLTRR